MGATKDASQDGGGRYNWRAKIIYMLPQRTRSEMLWQTSAIRIEHSRISLEQANAVLEGARSRVERARRRAEGIGSERIGETASPQRRVTASHPDSYGDDLLEIIQDQVIEGELVQLDGRHFVGCTLRNCTLEYGGSVVIVETTHFFGCRFRFTTYAAMTMQFLECLAW